MTHADEVVGQEGGNSTIWMVGATSGDMLSWSADLTQPTYPKTWAGIRSLTQSPPLAARIRDLRVVGNTPVFTSTGGDLINVANFRSQHFTPAVSAAGLGRVRIHDLRHSAISWWIHQGTTIKQVTARSPDADRLDLNQSGRYADRFQLPGIRSNADNRNRPDRTGSSTRSHRFIKVS